MIVKFVCRTCKKNINRIYLHQKLDVKDKVHYKDINNETKRKKYECKKCQTTNSPRKITRSHL